MTSTARTRAYWAGRNVVYRFYDEDDQLMYVGLTKNMPARLSVHRRESWWAERITRIQVRVHPTYELAREAEAAAIRVERPRFNQRHSQDVGMDHWTKWDLLYWCVTVGEDVGRYRRLLSPHGHFHDTLADTWTRRPSDPDCDESTAPSCVAYRALEPRPYAMPKPRKSVA